MVVFNNIGNPGIGRADKQVGGQRRKLRRSTSGISLAFTSELKVSGFRKKQILNLLTDDVSHPRCLLSEEGQEHPTPSLRRDVSNQERTYTRLVVSSRVFGISTTAYGQARTRDRPRRLDCHGTPTTNSTGCIHSFTRTRVCLNKTQRHSHPLERRLPAKTLDIYESGRETVRT